MRKAKANGETVFWDSSLQCAMQCSAKEGTPFQCTVHLAHESSSRAPPPQNKRLAILVWKSETLRLTFSFDHSKEMGALRVSRESRKRPLGENSSPKHFTNAIVMSSPFERDVFRGTATSPSATRVAEVGHDLLCMFKSSATSSYKAELQIRTLPSPRFTRRKPNRKAS